MVSASLVRRVDQRLETSYRYPRRAASTTNPSQCRRMKRLKICSVVIVAARRTPKSLRRRFQSADFVRPARLDGRHFEPETDEQTGYRYILIWNAAGGPIWAKRCSLRRARHLASRTLPNVAHCVCPPLRTGAHVRPLRGTKDAILNRPSITGTSNKHDATGN